MNSVPKISRWREGRVDRTREHFELRYESTVRFESDWSDWIPVAIVGPPKAQIVNVQFLVESGNPKDVAAVSDVKKEIQFYLIDKGEPDPGGTRDIIAGRPRISTQTYTGDTPRKEIEIKLKGRLR
jgi:hypothetical protein